MKFMHVNDAIECHKKTGENSHKLALIVGSVI